MSEKTPRMIEALSEKTPIEALEDFDFTVNTHKDATMKTVPYHQRLRIANNRFK